MKTAIVGSTGAVGKELRKLLEEREFVCFDSKSEISFEGIDLAFFCVPAETAKNLIPKAREQGVICIDSSTAYREDPSVPLVVPEINPHALESHKGIIASPNCTTTLMLMPLAPLHRKYQIKRIVAATYQAVSGAGEKGMEELEKQTREILLGTPISPQVFPSTCAFNVFLHESERDETGYCAEEKKMHWETRKILEDEEISVSATCIRVPVFRVHAQALNVEFAQPIQKEEIEEILRNTPGVLVKENVSSVDAAEQKMVLCGRIRLDHSQKNTLELWVVGDQLLKGAALNMVQIAEALK